MDLHITWQTAVAASAVAGAVAALTAYFARIVRWVDRQKEQDARICALNETHRQDMTAIHKEQTLMVYGVLACLKGLKEQGCNGPVTEAIGRIEKHLNQEAHK